MVTVPHLIEPVFCSLFWWVTFEQQASATRDAASDPPPFISPAQGAKGQDGAHGPPGAAGSPVSPPVLPYSWGLKKGPPMSIFSLAHCSGPTGTWLRKKIPHWWGSPGMGGGIWTWSQMGAVLVWSTHNVLIHMYRRQIPSYTWMQQRHSLSTSPCCTYLHAHEWENSSVHIEDTQRTFSTQRGPLPDACHSENCAWIQIHIDTL